jgi:hypothetical protein
MFSSNVSRLVFTEQSDLNEVLDTITQVLSVYSSVCDCVHLWNKTFAVPFLAILTILYINAVCSLFVTAKSEKTICKGSIDFKVIFTGPICSILPVQL